MDSPSLPPIYPPAATRDTSSPISDCIVVRDCDSSSVFTVDTTITSIVPTSDVSKENSRAGSVPTPMDTTEEVISSEEIHLVVKLETLTAPGSSIYSQARYINEPDLEDSTPVQTRVLRQRPPRLPPVKSPMPGRKARLSTPESIAKQPSPQLSDVIQIRGPAVAKNQNEGCHRRRSLRLSLIANNLSKHLDTTSTPKRGSGKRTHEIMNAGSKSADAKSGSKEWGNDRNSAKRLKGQGYSSEGESESSEEEGSEGEDEEGAQQLPKRNKIWAIQGLFVGQEENFDPRRRTKRGRLSGAGALPERSKTILPLPMFQGQSIMDNRRDFKLPFNIFSPTPYKVHPPGWKVLSRSMLIPFIPLRAHIKQNHNFMF